MDNKITTCILVIRKFLGLANNSSENIKSTLILEKVFRICENEDHMNSIGFYFLQILQKNVLECRTVNKNNIKIKEWDRELMHYTELHSTHIISFWSLQEWLFAAWTCMQPINILGRWSSSVLVWHSSAPWIKRLWTSISTNICRRLRSLFWIWKRDPSKMNGFRSVTPFVQMYVYFCLRINKS